MGSTRDYVIAGHRVRVEGKDLLETLDKIDGFDPFEVETDGDPVATLTHVDYKSGVVPEMKESLYTITLEDGVTDVFGRTDDGFRYSMHGDKSSSLYLWGKKGENKWYIAGNVFETGVNAERFVRFGLWIAFGLSTLHLDTVPIHTSTITYKGKNVLFLGESGTGKSTHTRLWRENIEGATLLNDDCPILRIKEDGSAWIYGSPWSGKTPCYKNESYPLAGCVRLSQAPYNKITRLRVLQAYGALHPSCPPDFAYDKDLYGCISQTIGKLLSTVPVYHLECLPNAEAAYLSCKTIFGDEQ